MPFPSVNGYGCAEPVALGGFLVPDRGVLPDRIYLGLCLVRPDSITEHDDHTQALLQDGRRRTGTQREN